MRNPFLVHINSTIIEMAPKTFKLIFAIEFISMALFLMCVPFLLIVLKRSKGLHRNFRVCLFSMCLHYTTASVARSVLFYYQLNDCELSHDDIVLVLAHLARDTVFGYFCAMPGSFAFERFIATRYWKWYENSGPSTLLIIPLVEANNIIPSLVNSYCWTFAMYSQELNFAILIVTLCAGLLYFFTIKRCNLRIMNKITCRLDAYSLAHNYQIRENIRTLKVGASLIGSLLKAAGLLNGMAVLLFSLFEYTSGLISRLAFAMFDMWVAIIAVLYVITLVYRERSFYVEAVNLIPIRKLRRALMPHSVSHSEPPSVAAITRTYFDNLHNAWNT